MGGKETARRHCDSGDGVAELDGNREHRADGLPLENSAQRERESAGRRWAVDGDFAEEEKRRRRRRRRTATAVPVASIWSRICRARAREIWGEKREL